MGALLLWLLGWWRQASRAARPVHHLDNELLWLGGSYCFTPLVGKTLVIVGFAVIEVFFLSFVHCVSIHIEERVFTHIHVDRGYNGGHQQTKFDFMCQERNPNYGGLQQLAALWTLRRDPPSSLPLSLLARTRAEFLFSSKCLL